MNMEATTKYSMDVAAWAAIFGALAGWLPAIAAIVAIMWHVLQIHSWFEHRYQKRREQKLKEKKDEGLN